MDEGVIPWQGLLASDSQCEQGGYALLEKDTGIVGDLEDSSPVCSRISSHPGYATLPRYFNILYQSFMPNCKLSLDVLGRYYRISRKVAYCICNGRNTRICNQRILTFMLTEFVKDFDILRFCVAVEQLIQLPELRKITEILKDSFPIKPKGDSVVVETFSEPLPDKKPQLEASCLQSSSADEEIVNTTVEEVRALKAQFIGIQRSRRQHLFALGLRTTNSTESTDGPLQPTQNSFAVFDTSHAFADLLTPSLNNEGHTLAEDSDSQHSDLASDELSEEVKSKPTEFSRSYSSGASSPTRSLPLLSPGKDDHSLLMSYGEDLYPAGSLSDRLSANSTPAADFNNMIPVMLQSGASAAATAGTATNPAIVLEAKGFEPLKLRYNSLYQSFPEEYMNTVSKLERHLNDTDISSILTCTSPILANKKILDSLIAHMNCKEDLLDFCEHLKKIDGSPNMHNIIDELRRDVVKNIQGETVVHSHSSSEGLVQLEPTVFSEETAIDPNSRVMKILKKYYNILCHSLPSDTSLAIAFLNKMGLCTPSLSNKLKTADSPLKINQHFIDALIKRLDCEERLLDFCDIIDTLVVDTELKRNIESIRNEILAVLSSKPQGSTDWRYPLKKKVFLMRVVPHEPKTYDANVLTADSEAGESILQPPPVPQYYIRRMKLEKELTNAMLDSNQDEAAVAVTVYGDEGFGKSTLVKAFCHNENVKQYFPNGFLFIELGSTAPDPLSKLKYLYRFLSHGIKINQDINSVVQMLHTLVIRNCPGILVIIDDICSAHDAQPYVRAFRSCKIVVTTRSDEVARQLSSCTVVTVGPMEPLEATKLLSSVTVQTTEDDEKIVNELVKDLFFWPLLICLARGLFQTNQTTIQTFGHLQSKLYAEGLECTAHNTNETVAHGRKVALIACVEASLQLLNTDEFLDLMDLVGAGGVITLQHIIHSWGLPEEDCLPSLTKLNSMGLIVFTHATASAKASVRIHSIISQYLESLQTDEQYQQAYPALMYLPSGSTRGSTLAGNKVLATAEFLVESALTHYKKYILYYFASIPPNIYYWATSTWHLLQYLFSLVNSFPNKFPDLPNLISKAQRLSEECQNVLMEYESEIEQLSRKVLALTKENCDDTQKAVEQYFVNFPLRKTALETKDLADKVVSKFDQQYKEYVIGRSEFLYCFMPEYDYALKLYLPLVMLYINSHKRITTAIASGPSAMKELSQEMQSNNLQEQFTLINDNYMIKLQEVAPHYVSKLFEYKAT